MDSSLSIQVKNSQNKLKMKKKSLVAIIQGIADCLDIRKGVLSFVFIDNLQIRALNKRYFNRDCPTDVICFPLKDRFDPLDTLGEIVISTEKVIDNSHDFGVKVNEELVLYLIHGMLHLLGYKDSPPSEKDKMKKKENKVLSFIKSKDARLIKNLIF